jgi:transcriptional regulator with PAS, ATPase and Fis domain
LAGSRVSSDPQNFFGLQIKWPVPHFSLIEQEIQIRKAAAGHTKQKRSKHQALKEIETETKKKAVKAALHQVGGHRRKASRILEISERALYYWIKDCNLLQ